jgi:hypothetical protein
MVMLTLLKLIHTFLGLNALGAGAATCTRMVTGRPVEGRVKHFLRFSLAAASVGLILSIGHTGLTLLLAMLSVYASAFAVLSWRKYRTSASWGAAAVLSTMCVLCLNTVITIAHIFKLLAARNVLGLAQPALPLAVAMVTVVLLFALLSMTALKKIHQQAGDPLMHKVAR